MWETEYQKFERRNDISSDSEAAVRRDKPRAAAFAIIGQDGLDNLEGYSPPWKERVGIFPRFHRQRQWHCESPSRLSGVGLIKRMVG